jgi:hypothetical protein
VSPIIEKIVRVWSTELSEGWKEVGEEMKKWISSIYVW